MDTSNSLCSKPKRWDSTNFIKSNTFNVFLVEEFYNLFIKYKKQYVCVMHGHIHVTHLVKHTNKDGCDIYLLHTIPATAIIKDEQIHVFLAMFTYNFETNVCLILKYMVCVLNIIFCYLIIYISLILYL